MLEFKIRNTFWRFDFTFFAVIVVLFSVNKFSFGIAALAACGIHELSHIIVMLITGVNPDSVTFYGGGIKISSSQIEKTTVKKKALILSAGCMANFITALCFWLNGNAVLALINLFTGIYNLLPFGELDGAALFKMIIVKLCRVEKIDRVMKIINVISATIIIVVLMFSGNRRALSVVPLLIYMVIQEILEN